MLGLSSDILFQVARDLAIARIVYLAYRTAKVSGERQGRRAALIKGAAICIGIALSGALLTGQTGCDAGDPLFGSCSDAAAGRHTPSMERLGGTFLYWLLLFGIPVTMGVMSALPHAADPWATPDRSRS